LKFGSARSARGILDVVLLLERGAVPPTLGSLLEQQRTIRKLQEQLSEVLGLRCDLPDFSV